MGLEVEGFEKGLMEVRGSPGGDTGSRMDEYFHEANQAGIVNFDACDFGMAGGDGESQTLEQREIDMDLESVSLEGCETVSDG